MKIRTDFVTNSSSSGFVVISIDMIGGKKIEIEREYDSGYGGYVWNCTDKKTLDNELSVIVNGSQLLEVLSANIKDWNTFIIGKSAKGKKFEDDVVALDDISDLKTIKIVEQTNFSDGDSEKFDYLYRAIADEDTKENIWRPLSKPKCTDVAIKDCKIDNTGVLLGYTGSEEHISLPVGVHTIGKRAWSIRQQRMLD